MWIVYKKQNANYSLSEQLQIRLQSSPFLNETPRVSPLFLHFHRLKWLLNWLSGTRLHSQRSWRMNLLANYYSLSPCLMGRLATVSYPHAQHLFSVFQCSWSFRVVCELQGNAAWKKKKTEYLAVFYSKSHLTYYIIQTVYLPQARVTSNIFLSNWECVISKTFQKCLLLWLLFIGWRVVTFLWSWLRV